MQEALVVRRETHVPAPPAAVFALLTDPERILRWIGTEAQVEPRPGGLYLVNVTGARFARGSFREVVPVHRLAYSFGWDGSEAVPPAAAGIRPLAARAFETAGRLARSRAAPRDRR